MSKTIRQLINDAKDSVLSYNHWPIDWHEDRRERPNVASIYLTQHIGKNHWWMGIANVVKYPGKVDIHGPGIEIRCDHSELQEGFNVVYKWVRYRQDKARSEDELAAITGSLTRNPQDLRRRI